MQTLTTEQLEKLPKWVRQHIEVCYKNIESMANKVDTLFQNRGIESDVYIPNFYGYTHVDGRDDLNVPSYFRLRIYKEISGLKDKGYLEFGFNRHNEVMVLGSHPFYVVPCASNSVEFKMRGH